MKRIASCKDKQPARKETCFSLLVIVRFTTNSVDDLPVEGSVCSGSHTRRRVLRLSFVPLFYWCCIDIYVEGIIPVCFDVDGPLDRTNSFRLFFYTEELTRVPYAITVPVLQD